MFPSLDCTLDTMIGDSKSFPEPNRGGSHHALPLMHPCSHVPIHTGLHLGRHLRQGRPAADPVAGRRPAAGGPPLRAAGRHPAACARG
jgi:hypothetical protein